MKGKTDIKKPDTSNGLYLWKYVDLHRLIDFIYSKELHFTRLDTFNDPIEGISTRYLRLQSKKLAEGELSEADDKYLKLQKYVDTETFMGNQKKQFVNCWFHDNKESMAMWEIYSSPDSVAIKVEAESFLDAVIKSADKFIATNGYRISVIGDLINYYPLNPFELKKTINIKYSAMKKDESYKYEQEYRLLINALPEWLSDEEKFNFRMPIELSQINLKVICHPLMSNWKFKNVERVIEKFSEVEVIKSSIKLR